MFRSERGSRPARSAVLFGISAANRDPERFERPDELRLDRGGHTLGLCRVARARPELPDDRQRVGEPAVRIGEHRDAGPRQLLNLVLLAAVEDDEIGTQCKDQLHVGVD